MRGLGRRGWTPVDGRRDGTTSSLGASGRQCLSGTSVIAERPRWFAPCREWVQEKCIHGTKKAKWPLEEASVRVEESNKTKSGPHHHHLYRS